MRSMLQISAAVAVTLCLGACGGSSPAINSVSVNPSTVRISGLVDTDTFVVSCSVLHFGGDVSSVTASVENQNITVDLAKTGGLPGDEQWTGSVQLLLFRNISTGVYQVDITANDTNGTTVTDKGAATVTVTQ